MEEKFLPFQIDGDFTAKCDGRIWILCKADKPIAYYQNLEDLYNGILRKNLTMPTEFRDLIREVRSTQRLIKELFSRFNDFYPVMSKDDMAEDDSIWD